MDPLIIVAVVGLLLTVVAALVIFRSGGDISPERARASLAPSEEVGPIRMKYPIEPTGDEPLQDVLEMQDEDVKVPMPSKLKGQPTQDQSGLVMDRPKPPVPGPGGGPVMRPFNPAVLGGDGAAIPAPGPGQKDVLNFTPPSTPKPGPKREE